MNSTIGWVLPVFGDCTYMEVRSPAGVLKEGLKPDIVPLEMLWGRFVGPMGTTAMLVIGACGLFLVFRADCQLGSPGILFACGGAVGGIVPAHRVQPADVRQIRADVRFPVFLRNFYGDGPGDRPPHRGGAEHLRRLLRRLG